MLNKNKIRLMARASMYEKRDGQKDFKRNEYFLGDYVRFHLIGNLIGVTIAYLLMAALYAICNVEELFIMVANMQIMVLLKEMLVLYVILMLVYTGISIIVYSWKYQKSRNRVRKYYRILKLIGRYEQEEK